MSFNVHESLSPDDPVDVIISAWLEAAEKGSAPDPEKIVAAHPEFATELREFFKEHFRIQGLAGPDRPSTKLDDGPIAAQEVDAATLPLGSGGDC